MNKNRFFFDDDFTNWDTWRVFRIMSEFVEGFEGLNRLKKAVSFFGSRRPRESEPYYDLAYKTANLFARRGYTVITGAGSGIMEAANRGAYEAKKSRSIGLNILLPKEQVPNPYVNQLLEFRYFFIRKVMFAKYSCAFVVFPGGYGTLDELFEAFALVQTNRMRPFPIVLVGKEFWSGLIDWFSSMLVTKGVLVKKDLSLFKLVDTPAQALAAVQKITGKK